MLLELLALAANTPVGAQPTISRLTLTPTGGSCSGSVVSVPAKIRLDWSVVSPNDVSYQVHVAVNGGAPSVLSSTATTTFTYSIAAKISGGRTPTSRTDSFEVRVVRTSDAVVVQTLTGSYSDAYGLCGGPA